MKRNPNAVMLENIQDVLDILKRDVNTYAYELMVDNTELADIYEKLDDLRSAVYFEINE